MKGHVQTVSRGVHRIYIENGRDPLTGRRRRITKTFHGPKAAAEEEATRLVLAVRGGEHQNAATSFGALLDAWLEHAEPRLEAWTMRGYRSKVEVHIRPALGEVKLSALTTARLDGFYRELLKRGSKRAGPSAGGALSPASVRHCHVIIHRACEQARRWGWMSANPAELAEPPSVERRRHELPVVAALFPIFDKCTEDMRELAWLAIISGARLGELCGLRWTDVDEHGDLRIERSIADIPGQEPIVKTTKSGRERRLTLDAGTLAIIASRRERQVHLAETTCEVPFDSAGYIFSETPGTTVPLRPLLVSTRWARAARTAGVKCRFHDLRHLGVTELLEAGFEIGAVSQRYGHAQTSITQDVYQHARRSRDGEAAEHLAKLLAPEAR